VSADHWPADDAGFLPEAWYVPAEEAQVPRQHRLLGFAVLVIAVGASLALPVAGVIVVTAGITLLRAVDRAVDMLTLRRYARGPRVWDAWLLLVSMPWMLVRSVVETVLLAPLVLLAAGIVVAAAIVAMGGGHLAVAAAAVAAVYTLLSCLGPRSRAPRRQLNRLLNTSAQTPLAAAMIALMLGALAAAVISVALSPRPVFWQVPGLHNAPARLPGVSLTHASTHR
jgi:serine/threonine kinase PknH